MRNTLLMMLAVTGAFAVAHAQNVKNADVMYKKEIVRAIDLREPQNKSLFARNREITALLMDAVLKGKIAPYVNDSLNRRLSIADFTKKITMPDLSGIPADTADLMMMYPDTWRDILANPPKPDLYFAKDLYQMELKEDVYFDKVKSRMDYNIKAITLYIPADHPANIRGIQDPVASFDYHELLKLLKDSPQAIWFNGQNDAQHKNLADAFELRLFSSYIIKVSNADDVYLADIYKDQQTGIMASQWAAHELLEYEHHLWEF